MPRIRRAARGAARWIVAGASVLALAMFAGVYTRVLAFFLFSGVGYLCWALARRLKSAG
jgi:hypothetical protein